MIDCALIKISRSSHADNRVGKLSDFVSQFPEFTDEGDKIVVLTSPIIVGEIVWKYGIRSKLTKGLSLGTDIILNIIYIIIYNIFVVHSMRGLVAKKVNLYHKWLTRQAVINACNSRIYKDVVASVKALVFLGTPHRGAEKAELKKP